MGWWPFNRAPLQASKLPQEKQQQAAAEPPAGVGLLQGSPAAEAVGAAAAAIPRPTSIFEFGPSVAGGSDYLRGMCAGDNPDAIQACTWSMEQAPGRARDKRPLYRIEF